MTITPRAVGIDLFIGFRKHPSHGTSKAHRDIRLHKKWHVARFHTQKNHSVRNNGSLIDWLK
jgi:hypothetical protein